jgi:hypothetical protein
MLLSGLGRNIVLQRRVELADFEINPPSFGERRRAAHASEAPMFRDSLDEGLVALEARPEGGERSAQSATTSSNTMLVAGWGGSVEGDVRVPFAAFNWFDLDFRGTGVQVDLAWSGPVAVLSANWPVTGSGWQLSVDSALSAVALRDRHADLTGRVSEEDLRRKEQRLQASFRRTLMPSLTLSLQPGVSYTGIEHDEDTSADYLTPPTTITTALAMRADYERRGYGLGLWVEGGRRNRFGPYGLPGDLGRTEVRRSTLHYSLEFDKSFHSPRMDRLTLDLGIWGGRDLDRFSAFRPRLYPGLHIAGYDSAGLRFTRGVTGEVSYAFPPIRNMRFELSTGGAVFENPEFYGDEAQTAWGASLAATFPGAWDTFFRARIRYGIDSTLPLDGSQGSIAVTMFKTFEGWWPWTAASRRRS